MGLMKKFETLGVAPAERLAYWNDLCDRIYVGTYVNSPEPDFGAQVWCWKVGALDMIRPRCDQSQVGRWGRFPRERGAHRPPPPASRHQPPGPVRLRGRPGARRFSRCARRTDPMCSICPRRTSCSSSNSRAA
ncbi:MAG: hypothetical protein WDN24_16160 [Sphingomonas sp.]